MRKGMLAQWRRGMVARGLAGAVLLAVPVFVAAAIGFGNSFAGIAGGLSSVAQGPEQTTVDTVASRTTPGKLNQAVAALADRAPKSDGTGGGGSEGGSLPENDDGFSGGGDNDGSGGDGSGAGGGLGGGDARVPDVTNPVGGGGGQPGGGGGETVNGVLDGLNESLGKLLGP